MGSIPIKSSPAVSSLLRNKRKEARLSLREASRLLAERGERIPASTLDRIEKGTLDPGVRRLHQLLRLYDVPPHLVADLIELEELAIESPQDMDLDTLYTQGVRHWKQGNIALGLAHLFALRQHVPTDEAGRLLRQKATLTFAVAARNLGKFRLARELVQDLLCEPTDASLLVEALVLSSTVWRGLGSPEVALALVRQAADHVKPTEPQKQAWVQHQRAKLLFEVGKINKAERCLSRVLKLYRQTADTYGEGRALLLRIQLLESRGKQERALACVKQVLDLAHRHGHRRLLAYGHLEQGRLLVKAGSIVDGLAALRVALGESVMQVDRNAEFLAHYWLFKAHELQKDQDRARFELQAAMHFVRFIDDTSPEAVEIRKLLKQQR